MNQQSIKPEEKELNTDNILIKFSLIVIWAILIIFIYYSKLWGSNFEWLKDSVNLNLIRPKFLFEAGSRAIIGILTSLCLILSAAFLGSFLLKIFKAPLIFFQEKLVFSISFGIGTFSYIGLLLAAFGFYKKEVLQILVILILISGFWYWITKGIRFSLLKKIKKAKKDKLFWIISGIAILFSFIAALAPETEFDALWYHLPYPQRYLESGFLVDIPYDYVSLYPMTFELWFGYGLAISGQIAAKLLHFLCLPIIGLAMYSFIRRFIPNISFTIAFAVFTTIPIVIWEASTTYIDLSLALYFLLMLYSLFAYFRENRISWLILSAINLGLALACKHLSLIVLVFASLGLIIFYLSNKKNLTFIIKHLSIFILISLFIASPWYFRSIAAAGNPFFPELYSIFGAPLTRWSIETQIGLKNFLEHFGPPRTLMNYIKLPWDMTFHASSFDGTLGPLFFILLPVLFFIRKKTKYILALIIFILLYIIFWASPLSSFQMRFLVPITPMLAILAALAINHINIWAQHFSKAIRFSVYSTLALLMFLNLPFFTELHEHDREGWNNWINHALREVELNVVLGVESMENYLSRKIASYKVWDFANKNLPENSFVLAWSNGDQYYSNHKRIWIYSVPALQVREAESNYELFNVLDKMGITSIILDKRDKYTKDLVIFSLETLTQKYQILYEDRFYILYNQENFSFNKSY